MERQTSTKYKVIFHIDEPSKGRADQVLMNIANLLDDRGDEDVKAALLANGSGIRPLVKAPEGQARQVWQSAGAQRGVYFGAGQHSLEHLNLRREDLLDQV